VNADRDRDGTDQRERAPWLETFGRTAREYVAEMAARMDRMAAEVGPGTNRGATIRARTARAAGATAANPYSNDGGRMSKAGRLMQRGWLKLAVRERAAAVLDRTLTVAYRGPRTLNARTRVARFLDTGQGNIMQILKDLTWLEQVAKEVA